MSRGNAGMARERPAKRHGSGSILRRRRVEYWKRRRDGCVLRRRRYVVDRTPPSLAKRRRIWQNYVSGIAEKKTRHYIELIHTEGKCIHTGEQPPLQRILKTGAWVPVFSNGKAEPRAVRTGARAPAFLNGKAGQRAGLAVCLSNS